MTAAYRKWAGGGAGRKTSPIKGKIFWGPS